MLDRAGPDTDRVRAPLTVAAAQPTCRPGDLVTNVAAHAELVGRAGARVVVFPELSLTGYVLDARSVDSRAPALDPLREVCAAAGAVALVGAPVEVSSTIGTSCRSRRPAPS